MAHPAKMLMGQELRGVQLSSTSRRVVVDSFGTYLLPFQVRADWAAIIAFLLGPGPEVTAHFYFEANCWRLHRLCESNGIGGAALLPEETLLAVVAAMQAGGRPVDVGSSHAPQ